MLRILILNSLFYLGVVMNYPSFFIFNPFGSSFTILGFLQAISTAGWVITICMPLILWLVNSIGAHRGILLAAVLVWPLSLLAIRAFMGIVTGNPGFNYLVTSPIFIITDLVAPALLIWWLLKDRRGVLARTAAR